VLCQLLDECMWDGLSTAGRASSAVTPNPTTMSFAPSIVASGHVEGYVALRCLLHVPGLLHTNLAGAPSEALSLFRRQCLDGKLSRSAPGSNITQSAAAIGIALSTVARDGGESEWAASVMSDFETENKEGHSVLSRLFAPLLSGAAPLDARSVTHLFHIHPFLLEGSRDGHTMAQLLMERHIAPIVLPSSGGGSVLQYSGFSRQQLCLMRAEGEGGNRGAGGLFVSSLASYLVKETSHAIHPAASAVSLLDDMISRLPCR